MVRQADRPDRHRVGVPGGLVVVGPGYDGLIPREVMDVVLVTSGILGEGVLEVRDDGGAGISGGDPTVSLVVLVRVLQVLVRDDGLVEVDVLGVVVSGVERELLALVLGDTRLVVGLVEDGLIGRKVGGGRLGGGRLGGGRVGEKDPDALDLGGGGANGHLLGSGRRRFAPVHRGGDGHRPRDGSGADAGVGGVGLDDAAYVIEQRGAGRRGQVDPAVGALVGELTEGVEGPVVSGGRPAAEAHPAYDLDAAADDDDDQDEQDEGNHGQASRLPPPPE